LSDILWELVGELGVGHAYVIGGDLRPVPQFAGGFLGAEFAWGVGGWTVRRLFRGSPWMPSERNPLMSGETQLKVGDVVLAVNGRAVSRERALESMLMGHAGDDVALSVRRGNKNWVVNTKTLLHDRNLRYRDWVESCRDFVHRRSQGRLGYVHIPDMGPDGYSEFFEQYLHEFDRDGLVIDVRFNGGGHVSPLILSRLMQRRIGADQTRWFGVAPYPSESPAGPIVALTNEFAGSDGDIFSHAFKIYKLGPLIGRRTWGGVIGIWPRHRAMDGGVSTQPEFSHWFEDVGWGVENYGTDPDIEVDRLPHNFAKGVEDAQLVRAVQEGLSLLRKHPPFRPKFPALPKRT
jgi:tricorn protease